MEGEPVQLNGWLHLRRSWKTRYKRKWFTLLSHGELYYDKSERHARPFGKGPINVRTVSVTSKGDRKLTITDKTGDEYRIKADSDEERNRWLEEIRSCPVTKRASISSFPLNSSNSLYDEDSLRGRPYGSSRKRYNSEPVVFMQPTPGRMGPKFNSSYELPKEKEPEPSLEVDELYNQQFYAGAESTHADVSIPPQDPLYFFPEVLRRPYSQSSFIDGSAISNLNSLIESREECIKEPDFEVDSIYHHHHHDQPVTAGPIAKVTITAKGREVHVIWPALVIDPICYMITLQELRGQSNIIAKNLMLELNSTSYFFMDLKSDTYYRCDVAALYESGVSIATSSDIVKTGPRELSPRISAEDMCIFQEIKSIEPCIAGVIWRIRTSNSNCKVCYYHIIVRQVNRDGTTEIFVEEILQAHTTHLLLTDIKVSCQYQIELTTTCKDLDADEIYSVVASHEFWPPVGKPKAVILRRADLPPDNHLQMDIISAEGPVDHYIVTLKRGDGVSKVTELPGNSHRFVFQNLEPCSYYSSTVVAVRNDQMGPLVESNKVLTAPAMPENVKIIRCDLTGSQIQVIWDHDERYDKHELLVVSNGKKEAHLILQKPPCTYSCLHMGVTYNLQLRACCGNVAGMWSSHASITLVPGAVHLSSTKVLDRAIELHWIGPHEGVDSYAVRLFGKSGLMVQESLGSKISTHKFENLLPGHLYHCSVSAENTAGSGTAGKSELLKIPWKKPAHFSASLDRDFPSHRALFTWDHPSGVNCFKLVIDDPDGQRQFETVEPQFLFQNGSAGMEYTCHLYCGCDGSYDSDSISLGEPLIMGPDPPTNIQILPEKSPNVINAKFDEPPVKPVGYKMTAVDLDENTEYEGTYVQPNCYFNNLARGKRYQLLIQSINSSGILSRTAYSDIFFTYPPKVTDLKLLSSANEWAKIKWKCSSQHVNCYLVRYNCGSKFLEEFVERAEIKLKGLKRGRCYYVSVAAQNPAGHGEFSDALEFQTALKDLVCVKVAQSEHQPTKSLIVELKDHDLRPKTYVVSAKAASDGHIMTTTTHQLTCGISGLRPGETYDVFARSEVRSKISKTAHAPEPIQTVPDKARGLAHETIGDDRKRLRWEQLPFPCKYRVRWKSSSDDRYTCDIVNGCCYEWKLGLKPGIKYLVQVAGQNEGGIGEWSEPLIFTNVGETEHTANQNGESTTLFEGEVTNPTFFNNAENVHNDRSTHMGDVRLLNVQIQGGTVCHQNPALREGAGNAIMNALNEFLSTEQRPAVRQNEEDQPCTSGLVNQGFCLASEESSEQEDENTNPKTLVTSLDQELSDEDRGEDCGSQQLGPTMVNEVEQQTDPFSVDCSVRSLRQPQYGDDRHNVDTTSNRDVGQTRNSLLRLFSCCINEQPSHDEQVESLLGSSE